MSTLTLAAITTIGLIFALLFQIVEGHIEYATVTMAGGLMLYFLGAFLAAFGGVRKA